MPVTPASPVLVKNLPPIQFLGVNSISRKLIVALRQSDDNVPVKDQNVFILRLKNQYLDLTS